MNAEELAPLVSEHLFAEDANVFAVLDGASIPGLLEKFHTLQPEYICLWRGELEPDLAEVASYLVQLELDSEFTNWMIAQGWGQHWGIFVITYADLREMRKHFRTLLTVYDDQGQPLVFRFYDPRVLRVYLPTCNEQELETVFGPVISYLLEDEDPSVMLHLVKTSGTLRRKRLPLVQS